MFGKSSEKGKIVGILSSAHFPLYNLFFFFSISVSLEVSARCLGGEDSLRKREPSFSAAETL